MMGIIKSIILSGLFISSIQAQQSPQLLFDKANTLLANNQYMDALTIYRQIDQGSEVSGALYLNMGIASTQIDSLGLAKYYFLKATQFESTNESAVEALEYVESQFSRQSATLPKLPWDRAIDWLKNGPTSSGVFFIGFACILTAIGVLIMSWFNIISFKKLSSIVSTFSLSGILIIALAFYVDYVDQRYSEAVIITGEVQVKQKADDTSDLISLGYEGYSITIDHKISNEALNWKYIRLGNGQFGWIKDNGVKIL